MGKSPAKWIKSVLFGKKSSRGRDGLKSTNRKGTVDGKEPSLGAVDSPVISEPILVNNKRNGIISESENGTLSNLAVEAVTLVTSQNTEGQQVVGQSVARDAKNASEEMAAVKVQAVFRGYLSRRAFRVLKGIIRLQAVIRGHLVRRQAIATLYCLHGIVKLQAIIRGRRVRVSNIDHEVKFKKFQMKDVDNKQLYSLKEKLSTRPFIYKLLSATSVTESLKIHYVEGEANAPINWLERWTLSRFWVPIPKPKKTVTSKSRPRRSSIALEGESGRGKRNAVSNPLSAIVSGPNIVTREPERLKHSLKKSPKPPVDCMPENPQNELEKVKRSLRKVTHSAGDSCEKTLSENQKSVRITRKVATLSPGASEHGIIEPIEKIKEDITVDPGTKSDAEDIKKPPGASEQGIIEPIEKMKEDITVDPGTKSDAEDIKRPLVPVESDNALDTGITIQVNASESLQKEDISMMNELVSKEQACDESHISNRKRASISSKSEQFEDDGLERTPKLPSYMAATQSAKAKLRGQASPRFGSDSAERSSITRRHSLPSSVNGKLNSQSPRTQKLIQATCKVGIRNDRSLSSSRDGSEKAIQVAWRR